MGPNFGVTAFSYLDLGLLTVVHIVWPFAVLRWGFGRTYVFISELKLRRFGRPMLMLEWLLFVFFGVFAFFCVRDFDPCLLINIEGRGSGSGDLVKIVRLALLRLVPAKPMEVS